jgi:hypothetical protein
MSKKLEKGLTTVYNNIPDCAQEPEDTPEGKFQKIVQVMEQYKKDITELTEKLILLHLQKSERKGNKRLLCTSKILCRKLRQCKNYMRNCSNMDQHGRG